MTDPGGSFGAKVRKEGDVAIITLSGDIDATVRDRFARVYEEASRNSTGGILLDFSSVSYMDSMGIALVVGILANARKDGHSVGAYGLSDHYREVFEITRIVDLMSLHADEAGARRAFGLDSVRSNTL